MSDRNPKRRLCRPSSSMELGGFEPPTSWVRCNQTLRRRAPQIRIVERCSGGFLEKAQPGCTSRYAPI
jgi:hypothetical protein